jgi:hypothetical protein
LGRESSSTDQLDELGAPCVQRDGRAGVALSDFQEQLCVCELQGRAVLLGGTAEAARLQVHDGPAGEQVAEKHCGGAGGRHGSDGTSGIGAAGGRHTRSGRHGRSRRRRRRYKGERSGPRDIDCGRYRISSDYPRSHGWRSSEGPLLRPQKPHRRGSRSECPDKHLGHAVAQRRDA